MIQLLAVKYRKPIAYVLAFIFYLGMLIPVYATGGAPPPENGYRYYPVKGNTAAGPAINSPAKHNIANNKLNNVIADAGTTRTKELIELANGVPVVKAEVAESPDKIDIDGPSQPEMSSFKPAGTNDMVNLFTGDFSYNIPLLDVGGYPVNIFYDGGIGMEQEASWVGLGWNINPGNINRNMRGVPDDFDGTEKLIQEQNMKKNITWGVSLGADLELLGIKKLRGQASLGISVNNYLGPALELGYSASYNLAQKSVSEKYAIGASVGLNLNLSSRSGLTTSPSASLSITANKTENGLSNGTLKLSTSYNSRSGIKALQLAGQVKFNSHKERYALYYDDYYSAAFHQSGTAALNLPMLSSSISFVKPSYIPSMRASITNSSGAGRFQLGFSIPGGIYPSGSVSGYGQVSTIELADRHVEKPMVGFIYAEKAKDNRDAVMDFTRFNDQEVTPKSTIISVPQYAYDVFSIQGEGTGGTIRAYRNDNGYVRDNYITSKDKSWSAGVDIGAPMPYLFGLPGHWGGNFNTVKTPSTSGEWHNGNKLRNTIGFGKNTGITENVYFRNPGENSVLHPNQYDSIGGTDLVRFKIGGTKPIPTIEPVLERFTSSGAMIGEVDIQRSLGVPGRKKRTQVTSFLIASEAKEIGLDRQIKNYSAGALISNDTLNYTTTERDSGHRKGHHISQINVTEADGKRYVYGLPVYNLTQTDFSFTVDNNCDTCDKVPFSPGEETINSTHINSGLGGKDGYVQKTETPPYAHSYLLSGLLSPDYVDVNGDGITEDDLGGAVKFNYTYTGIHKWRTPLSNDMEANSSPGKLSERKDDKGMVSYGERESWYLHSIESKTMIAFFTLDNRNDGKGATGPLSGIDYYTDNTIKCLSKIDLYNKADIKKNGIASAKPVKSVHFKYSYFLCPGSPDNQSGGKLTLDSIWFTYNGQTRANKNKYVFSYTKNINQVAGENPSYEFNGSDRWGNYKPRSDNPGSMKNRDYPYTLQNKSKADTNANAWLLKRILLPSGGQLEVEYESDDYAFVQNKRAALMSEIIGFSQSQSNPVNRLFSVGFFGAGIPDVKEHDYMFVKVPVACTTKTEVYERYLQGVSQIAVRFLVNMPKGQEYITAYTTFNDYGVYTSGASPAIWIKMNRVNGSSPLSQTAIEFLREQLPGQAFPGYDVSGDQGIKQVLSMLEGMWQGIKSAFSDIPKYLKQRGLAQVVQVDKSFARLNDPDGFKYGGGYRVKKITLKDNWKKMTSPNNPNEGYTSVYGQEYEYTTTEVFNGTERGISSGVASYEPSLGGEENPFQTIVQIANEVPLGPTSYGAIEMPVMDAFFPAPVVGYSKVTVRSVGKKQNPDTANKKTRSAVGRQVTEFYTAKDFPVYYSYTGFDPASDVQHHINLPAFFYNYARDSRALSQGFLVATNNMHGKMKSQASYSENDPNARLNYTENYYRNTGKNGFAEQFDFVHNKLGGEVIPGNMGIDIELMTDTREFMARTIGLELQGQVDNLFPPIPPFFPGIWVPTLWPVVTDGKNTYRAVTTTKVINYHAVLDSVLVIDKGSQVSTKNLIYDAETGQVVVNRTNNEFNKPIYSVTYPAYWAYSGMGLSYKNIDAVFENVSFLDGRIISPQIPDTVFESGDELYIMESAAEPPQVSTINGSVSLQCSDAGCTQQGLMSINFNFSTPTPAALTIQVGQVNTSQTGTRGTGYDIYTLPPGVTPDNYYQPYQNQTFNFTVPQGTTSISFPGPNYIGNGNVPWICHSCIFPTSALYIKGFSSNNLYQTSFTTGQSYTVTNIPIASANCAVVYSDPTEKLIWAFDTVKNSSSLANLNPYFIFIDKSGKPYTRSGVKFRIVRSGKRNMLGAPVASVALMTNPVDATTHKLTYTATSKVINSSAVEYKEKWQVDNDVFKKKKIVQNSTSVPAGPNLVVNGGFESGQTGFQSIYETPLNWGNGKTYSVWGGGLSPGVLVLAANGNDEPPSQFTGYIWRQTITVNPNTNYQFSFWTRSTGGSGDPHPNLIVDINGVGVAAILPTTPQWVKCEAVWNSGSNTSAIISITDHTLSLNGNDFELDNIVFNSSAYFICEEVEVDDCSGYFEKKINPYVKGLLGNFRGYRNMVFYSDRAETDPLSQTNLPVNGFLTGFSPYWNFNGNNNLVPAVTNTKWVWNTESTRFNSKGMELETKDALGIYTSAQYGYKKTLPVAIANNSRFGEMFYEGFEDDGYNDLLNSSAYDSCAAKYIDFSGNGNGAINAAALYGIKAHTGKNVLRINPSSTLFKSIQSNILYSDFNLRMGTDTSTSLYLLGGEGGFTMSPNGTGSGSIGFGSSPLSMTGSFAGNTSITEFEYGVSGYSMQYTNVTTPGIYQFNLQVRLDLGTGLTGDGYLDFYIYDKNGTLVAQRQVPCNVVTGINICPDQLSVFLCTGIYSISTSFSGTFSLHPSVNFITTLSGEVSYWSNLNSISYSSLASNSTCTFTKPIAASDTLMNSVFTMPSSFKKMVFSAWVREAETNVPTYTNNEVQVNVGGGSPVILKPTGPIIEGWQRYEGYFTTTGSPVTLSFVNNSNQPIYFDDIRIHPFNSNMKSYVYDPINLRLTSELDANNYASFYEYDAEGTLIRTKVETQQGIKTVTESRSAKQKNITDFN